MDHIYGIGDKYGLARLLHSLFAQPQWQAICVRDCHNDFAKLVMWAHNALYLYQNPLQMMHPQSILDQPIRQAVSPLTSQLEALSHTHQPACWDRVTVYGLAASCRGGCVTLVMYVCSIGHRLCQIWTPMNTAVEMLYYVYCVWMGQPSCVPM